MSANIPPNQATSTTSSAEQAINFQKSIVGLRDDFGRALALVIAGLKKSNTGGAEHACFEPITDMVKFFPVVAIELRQGMYYKEIQALRELTFEEKALMSSTTIECNELYHKVFCELQILESKLVKEVILCGYSPAKGRAAFLEEVERSITSNHRFHDLQSQLLKLRIERYRAEALVDKLPKGSNTDSDSEADTNTNHGAAAAVTIPFDPFCYFPTADGPSHTTFSNSGWVITLFLDSGCDITIWKKNSPFLYDLVLTHALDWPTLTTQWFPDQELSPDKSYTTQRILIGTHTSDNEPNYLQIVNVRLPNPNCEELGLDKYDKQSGEIGSYSDTQPRFKVIQSIPHVGEVNWAWYMPQDSDLIAAYVISYPLPSTSTPR
ncbi:hypothetical protein PSTT_13795 [Puccinia striiformis]|uniref:Histone-binding protein RBBP4-like N-terminal domain-containing protein n=1 Tax=Puccinia striiformis TaxID=27350 RepID=A0A2S4UQ65_9BASI|nr:hypothetical protein PSTT_13795 [Puccinia striiformis]